MNQRRIVQLIASSRGGGASHVRDLAISLDPSRFAVQVAMPDDGGHVSLEALGSQGIRVHQIEIGGRFPLAAALAIRRLVIDADILHVHGARAGFWGRLVALTLCSRRPRVVYTIHGLAVPYYPRFHRLLFLLFERALAHVTDAYVAVARSERETLLEMRVARSPLIHVVRNGINVGHFQDSLEIRDTLRFSQSIPTNAILISMVCRLHKPRDFDTLLRAFRQVAEACSTAFLLIVGDGPDWCRVEKLARTLNITDRVRMMGQLDDVRAAYETSDIYVLTTWGWEGLPLSVLEAMAGGLPVVATTAGGIPEAVEHGKTGLLVKRHDAGGLAEALLALVRNPSLRREMGEAGRKCVEAHFGVEPMCEQLMGIYASVLSDRS